MEDFIMTTTMRVLALVSALGACLEACNVHDNTINATANIPNASLSVTADTDVNNVTPAQAVPMTVSVQNVYLVDPNAAVPPEHDADAGYLEFHLDDETTTALLVTAQTSVQVPIPATTPPGPHKIICRVHKHDGEPTQTEFEVDIMVKVSVTTMTTSGNAGADGGAAGATGAADAGADAGAGGMAGSTVTTTVAVDASVTVTN
jgi:hypothetical protein